MQQYIDALNRIGDVHVSSHEHATNPTINTYCYSDMELLRELLEKLKELLNDE